MTYGITAKGFVRKTADEIRDDIKQKYKQSFGNDFDVSDDSPEGVEIGIWTDLLSNLWELAEGCYFSSFPDYAQDINLENASSITGISKLNQKKSKVLQVQLSTNESSPVIIPVGTILKQSFNNVEWQTTQTVTIPSNGNVITEVESVDYGAFTADIGSIDTIVTIISGLDEVTNLTTSLEGRLQETDAELKLRRAVSLVTSKGGTLAAVINSLKTLNGVTYANGKENRTNSTNIDGLPPHSISLTVEGGNDLDIANKINEVKGDGIETFGTNAVTVTDEEGNPTIIYFNRATIKDVYIILNLSVNSDYPSNGDITAKALINNLSKTYNNGDDVLKWRIAGVLDAINGINDVEVKLGFAPSPTGTTNLAIAINERARILTSNIVVNHV